MTFDWGHFGGEVDRNRKDMMSLQNSEEELGHPSHKPCGRYIKLLYITCNISKGQ